MGNKQLDGPLLNKELPLYRQDTELSQSEAVQESVWEEQIEQSNTCCFNYEKKKKRKIVWENKFVDNCMAVRESFAWAVELIELVNSQQLPKVKYFKEMHLLKHEKVKVVESVNEVLVNPDDVERFKRNLKKSVILSFAPSRHHQQLASKPNASIAVLQSRNRIDPDSRKTPNVKAPATTGREKNPSQHSFDRKSGQSFVDESMSSGFDNAKQIPKQAAAELQIFLKFSVTLQRHLSDSNCMLGRIRRHFVQHFERQYKDPVYASGCIDEVVESVGQFLFVLKAAVMDYYNLQSFTNGPGSNIFIASEENVLSTCTAIFFKDHIFYNCLFNAVAENFKERDQKFGKILDHLKDRGPEYYTVKDKFCLNNRTIKTYLNLLSEESDSMNIVQNIEITEVVVSSPEPYKFCMSSLSEVARSRSPINKLKSIMACSEGITQQIEKFYDLNGLRKERWMLDADQVLSIFCYIIVGARVPNIHTHLFLLEHFASNLQMISMTGYYMSVINCAVEQLQIEFGLQMAKLQPQS